MTKVRKIMRGDVVGLSVNDPIEKACRLMVEQGLGALPVVETDGQLIGILPDGDVLARVVLEEIRRRQPRLLVMGGPGHHPVRDVFVTSVTRAVLQETPVPVFTGA